MTRLFTWNITFLKKIDVKDSETIHFIGDFSPRYFSKTDEWINWVDDDKWDQLTDGKGGGRV